MKALVKLIKRWSLFLDHRFEKLVIYERPLWEIIDKLIRRVWLKAEPIKPRLLRGFYRVTIVILGIIPVSLIHGTIVLIKKCILLAPLAIVVVLVGIFAGDFLIAELGIELVLLLALVLFIWENFTCGCLGGACPVGKNMQSPIKHCPKV